MLTRECLSFQVVHGADGSAGSRAVYREGKVPPAERSSSITNSPGEQIIMPICPLPPAATASHSASEGNSGCGGRHPQVHAKCSVESH